MTHKAYFRWAQSFLPFTRPLKFRAYNVATRILGKKMEPEFEALGRLGPVKLALDIGGNWGQSIEAFRWCSSPARIVSFEPNADMCRRLQRQYAGDGAIDIRPYALSDHEGSMELFVPRYRNYVYDGLASTVEEKARGWLNDSRLKFFDPAKLKLDRQIVELRMLDSLDLAPDLVKIDVQGAEEMVVRGGRQTFAKYQPTSIVEFPSEEVVKLFGEFDMRPYSFDGKGFSPYIWQTLNAIFATPEKLAAMQGE